MNMPTTIEIQDTKLIEVAIKLGSHPTPAAAIEAALREYVRARMESWEEWIGKVPYVEDYDYKASRKRGSK